MKYSQDCKPSAELRPKQAVLAKLVPPHQRTVKDVPAEEGISPATLYHWHQQARLTGGLFPDDGADPEGWTARDKFTAVMETAALNESEHAEYCRKRGFYPQQITAWRRACESVTDWARARGQQQAGVDRKVRREVRSLKRELQCKEKALAETAALLTLSKKARAIWGRARPLRLRAGQADQHPGSPACGIVD